jgi:hypothetical protein
MENKTYQTLNGNAEIRFFDGGWEMTERINGLNIRFEGGKLKIRIKDKYAITCDAADEIKWRGYEGKKKSEACTIKADSLKLFRDFIKQIESGSDSNGDNKKVKQKITFSDVTKSACKTIKEENRKDPNWNKPVLLFPMLAGDKETIAAIDGWSNEVNGEWKIEDDERKYESFNLGFGAKSRLFIVYQEKEGCISLEYKYDDDDATLLLDDKITYAFGNGAVRNFLSLEDGARELNDPAFKSNLRYEKGQFIFTSEEAAYRIRLSKNRIDIENKEKETDFYKTVFTFTANNSPFEATKKYRAILFKELNRTLKNRNLLNWCINSEDEGTLTIRHFRSIYLYRGYRLEITLKKSFENDMFGEKVTRWSISIEYDPNGPKVGGYVTFSYNKTGNRCPDISDKIILGSSTVTYSLALTKKETAIDKNTPLLKGGD